ncbi:MAG TPA: hypothetical protein VNT75_31790, partial [Symbiobacteriaceae bacterium]|nr:hypothetical protein [Symbiobacteriaceae bacterium]
MHPFRLMDAFLAADRLWFRYELKGRVAAARLAGPSVDLLLVDVATGLLAGPVPEAGGRLTLLVEAASPAAELPWRVDVHLAPQALADYWAAEPLGATADLGDGMTL